MSEQQEYDRLHISVGESGVGTLGRGESRSDSVFTYVESAQEESAISLTMPTRLESYTWEHGVPPIFEMNLPEGVLRATQSAAGWLAVTAGPVALSPAGSSNEAGATESLQSAWAFVVSIRRSVASPYPWRRPTYLLRNSHHSHELQTPEHS